MSAAEGEDGPGREPWTRSEDQSETLSRPPPPNTSETAADLDLEDRRSPPLLPNRLGSYRVLGQLGRGAMGVVHEAIDTRDGSTVAIKVVKGMSPDALYRFKREFRSLATFEHRNVVSLYELVMENGRLFFTMELVRGIDLVTWSCGPELGKHRHRPCSDYARVVAVFTQLATGIRTIHRAGLLHRDLKPSNVLVTEEGRVVILDFGLVRDDRFDPSRSLTEEGVLMGTPLYMSPEQAGSEPVGPPCDWYALGEMLYEVLTGQPPFSELGMFALLAAKRETDPPEPRALVSSIPPHLATLCMELLSREPERRPDADAVLTALGAVDLAGGPSGDARSFLGRERESEALRQALAATGRRRPVVALVEGPSGIGKTTLVEHVLEEARQCQPIVLLRGKCSEREAIPYKALDSVMDALTLHLRGLPSAAEVRAFLPREMGALSRLFPVLLRVPAIGMGSSRGDWRAGADPAELRRRSFAALGELWARISDRERLVIWLDDLQWADLDSVVLLEAVLRRTDAPAMLLVCSFRSGTRTPAEPLSRLLDELERRETELELHHVPVGAMDIEDAAQVALELLGDRSRRGRSLADEVARESEGSPFFVEELVRYVLRTQGESPAQATTTDSAVSLDNVIRRRLEELPDDARALIDVLAVGGGRLSSSIALGVAFGEGRGGDALRRLYAEHLVRRAPGGEETIEIVHDRVRETALREIDRARLPGIHLALGRGLAASGNADEVALSHHFRQAGEEQLATLHTLAAADQAAAALAFDRAAQLYKAVLDLDALAGSELAAVEASLGEALANAGRLYDSAQAYLRAAQHAHEDQDVEWLRRAAEHLLSSGHSEEGRIALRRVLSRVGLQLPRSDTRAIVSLLRQRAALAIRGFGFRERETDDIPRRTLEQLDVCWTAARGLIYTDGLAGADFHARHLRLALRSGDPVRIARALGCEAHLMLALGADRKLDRARDLLDQAAALAERSGSPYARGMVMECSGHGWIAVGNWEKAFEELQSAIGIFREHCTDVSPEIGYCQAHAAICLLMMGRVTELSPLAYDLLREAQERAHPYLEGFARGLLGNIVLLALDRVEEAEEQLEIYRRDAPRRFQAHMLNHVCQTAALERYRGRPARAWDAAQRDWPDVARLALLRSPHARAELWLWRGACAVAGATARTDAGARLKVAREMAEKLRRHPSLYARGYGALTQAGASALQGDTEHAISLLHEAIAAFDAHEMAGFAAAARQRLGALVGGDEGRASIDAAQGYMRREGIVRPERFVAMTSPGFTRT